MTGELVYLNSELQLRLASIRIVVVASDAKKRVSHTLIVPVFSLWLKVKNSATHRIAHIT